MISDGNGHPHLYKTAAADVLPNPYADLGHGGPEGKHWYHGTHTPFVGAPKSPRWDYEGHQAENWSTDLGTHYTALHDVAKDIAKRKGTLPDSRVAHTQLHMSNPADYENEHELTDHAIDFARQRGMNHGPHEDPNVDEIDQYGTEDASLAHKETWLGHHPQRHAISEGFIGHLKDQGHDGITYGNSHEGPESHPSAIAFHDTPVSVDRWENLHHDHQEDDHGRTAGKGKARHHAPDVARRADQEGEGRPQDVDPDSGPDAVGAPLRALAEHPKVASDLKRLPRPLQAVYHDRVDDLRRGQAHPSTHALNGPLKGWNATSLNFKTRVVHRNVGDELHVLSAGNHDEAYDQGVRRTAKESGGRFTHDEGRCPECGGHGESADGRECDGCDGSGRATCPCGQQVAYDFSDGYQHLDGSISHDGDLSRYSVSDLMDLGRLPTKRGRYTAPTKRLFGPTYGLDSRLWEGDQLKFPIRLDIVATFADFCGAHGYVGWNSWAKIVFFGSEASEWTSKSLHGNDDFDLSIGIDYPTFRAANATFADLTDGEIADRFTQQMHAELNHPEKTFPGVEGSYDQTWFANIKGWNIAEMRPYAAYDVDAATWIVKPPRLPEWSVNSFPEGPGLAQEIRGIIEMAQGILAMPEPYRTQNGSALWEYVHSNRSDAFGPQGEGWWDSRNVVEKALDQKGLMQGLFDCHRRAAEDPSSLDSPGDWSNDPATVQ